jgi:NitT/TauT family transport system permease protein
VIVAAALGHPLTFLSVLRAKALNAWLPAAVFVLLIVLWESVARLALVDPMVLPAPSDIAANFVDGFRSGIYTKNLQITLVQAFSGFALACVLGIGVGSIASFSERFSRALQPILIAVEATPKIALAPLIIVWFGYGVGSKIVLAGAIAFFPVFISTAAGLRSAEPGRLDVLRALGASRFQLFRMVALPSAVPHIFAGINVAVVLALLGTIVGEFMGAKEGLGTLILYANGNLDTARVFSILLVLAATGLVLHWIIGAIRRRLLFWDASRAEAHSGAGA